MYLIVATAVGAVLFAIALRVRRWYALLIPVIPASAILVRGAFDGGLGDSEHTPEETLLIWGLFVLAPTMLATALRVITASC